MSRAPASVLVLAASLAGCGGGVQTDTGRVRGDTLTVYTSGPRHGLSAAAGEAVFAGQRRALEQAGGRAGGRRIRLVRLAATRPGDTVTARGSLLRRSRRLAFITVSMTSGDSLVAVASATKSIVTQAPDGPGGQ